MSTNYGNQIAPSTNVAVQLISIVTNTTLTGYSFSRHHVIGGTGNYTITLPLLSSGASGRTVTIYNDTASGTSTIAAQGADNIRVNGANQATISLPPGDSVTLEHNGAAWTLADTNILKVGTASPAFTGTPTAPTATQGTNTTQLATTAFVIGQAATTNPAQVGTVNQGAATTFARADHVHPATAPTPSANDNSTNLATTAFVLGTANTYAKAQRGTVGTLPATTGTVNFDFSLANNFSGQVTGACTFANTFTNAVAGQSGVIRIQQNGSTAYNWAFGTYWKYVGGSTAIPSQTSTLSAYDEIIYFIHSTTEISFAVRSNVS